MHRVNRFGLLSAIAAMMSVGGAPAARLVRGTPDPGGPWLKGKKSRLAWGRGADVQPNPERRRRRELEALLGERISGRQWKRIRKDRHTGRMRERIDAALAGVEE